MVLLPWIHVQHHQLFLLRLLHHDHRLHVPPNAEDSKAHSLSVCRVQQQNLLHLFLGSLGVGAFREQPQSTVEVLPVLGLHTHVLAEELKEQSPLQLLGADFDEQLASERRLQQQRQRLLHPPLDVEPALLLQLLHLLRVDVWDLALKLADLARSPEPQPVHSELGNEEDVVGDHFVGVPADPPHVDYIVDLREVLEAVLLYGKLAPPDAEHVEPDHTVIATDDHELPVRDSVQRRCLVIFIELLCKVVLLRAELQNEDLLLVLRIELDHEHGEVVREGVHGVLVVMVAGQLFGLQVHFFVCESRSQHVYYPVVFFEDEEGEALVDLEKAHALNVVRLTEGLDKGFARNNLGKVLHLKY